MLAALGVSAFSRFKKSWATIVENFDQPIRNAAFDFEDRANPQIKLLPVDVLIASVVKPLPRDAAGLIVCALAGGSLKLGGRVAFGVAFRFLQAAVPQGHRTGRPSRVVSERAAEPV